MSTKKLQLKNAAIDMTEGSPFPLIIRFALPLIFGNLIQQIYSISDAFIVSHFIGSDALGSVGVSSSIQFLVLGFCIGFCGGLAVPVAQSVGAKDREGVSRYIVNGVIITVLFSLILTAVFSILTGSILKMLNTDTLLYENAYRYLLITFLGIPCTMAYNLGAGILRSAGNSRAPFIYLLVSSAVNIVLDLLLVTVFKAGITGAASATLISQALSGILCFTQIGSMKLVIRSEKRLSELFDIHACRKLLAMGIPMGLQYSVTAVGTIFVQRGNNDLGQVFTTGFSAGTKIRQFAMCPFDAIASGAAVFAAQNFGAGKTGRIQKGIRTGIITGVVYGLVSGIIMFAGSSVFPLLFIESDRSDILEAASSYLASIGPFLWLLGILNVCRMSVQNLGFARLALISGIVELASRIILCVFFVPLYGYRAICFNEPAAWICASLYISVINMTVMRSVRRKI